MSASEDKDCVVCEPVDSGIGDDQGDNGKPTSRAAKWRVAGILFFYTGMGGYCLASALGYGLGQGHPQGVARSVATALGKPTAGAGAGAFPKDAARPVAAGNAYAARDYAAKVAASTQVAKPPAPVEVLTAISATAIGPEGPSDGDHPQLASLVLSRHSMTSWITQWYASAHFGNLKDGTGLLLDMGRVVTIRQLELALGGGPGLWGADVEIRIGQTPDLGNAAPVAVANDVGGSVSPRLHSPVTGRYVQIWFTKLPLDSRGTYQEHVYGVTVRGSVPAPHKAASKPGASGTHTTHDTSHRGRGVPGTNRDGGHGNQ